MKIAEAVLERIASASGNAGASPDSICASEAVTASKMNGVERFVFDDDSAILCYAGVAVRGYATCWCPWSKKRTHNATCTRPKEWLQERHLSACGPVIINVPAGGLGRVQRRMLKLMLSGIGVKTMDVPKPYFRVACESLDKFVARNSHVLEKATDGGASGTACVWRMRPEMDRGPSRISYRIRKRTTDISDVHRIGARSAEDPENPKRGSVVAILYGNRAYRRVILTHKLDTAAAQALCATLKAGGAREDEYDVHGY